MTKEEKKKLCWSCDGRVPREAENCPYCGVYLSNTPYEGESAPTFDWDPPYKIPQDEEPISPEHPKPIAPPKPTKPISPVIPLAALISGSTFFLFSLILYFCSTEGTLTLKWDSHTWYVWLLLSFPLFGAGWYYLPSSPPSEPTSPSQ
ncbi:MAG: hypothetical protein KDK65_04715 [Chlamydiia bacterium]|nr:hypothetical protein [Chlamydiia bacterium]